MSKRQKKAQHRLVPIRRQLVYWRAQKKASADRSSAACVAKGHTALPLHPCPIDADLYNNMTPTCTCCTRCAKGCENCI